MTANNLSTSLISRILGSVRACGGFGNAADGLSARKPSSCKKAKKRRSADTLRATELLARSRQLLASSARLSAPASFSFPSNNRDAAKRSLLYAESVLLATPCSAASISRNRVIRSRSDALIYGRYVPWTEDQPNVTASAAIIRASGSSPT